MEKTTGDAKTSETLAEDCVIEYISFKARTAIIRRERDGALLQATLHDEHKIYDCEFSRGDILEFLGEESGALVKATITGTREIQGVLFSAASQPVTVHFHNLNGQLRPGLKSATSKGDILTANNIRFKRDSMLLFHRPGHIGAGDLHEEVQIDDLWFGPVRSAETETSSTSATITSAAITSSTSASSSAAQGDCHRPSGIATVSSLKLTSKPAWRLINLNSDIAFYNNGHVAYGILSRNQLVNGLLLKAGSRVFFYSDGQLCAGTLAEPTMINGIKATGRFRFRETGTLFSAELAGEQMIDGINCTGQVKLYDNGRLYASTIVGKQRLGEFLCEGHFTLLSNGLPDQFYLAESYPERGNQYNKGWIIRFGRGGFSAQMPGQWKDESFDLVSPDWDFKQHYQPIAAICTNKTCACHKYDAVSSFDYRNEMGSYLDKGRALTERQFYAEAAKVQAKALTLLLRYQPKYGGELLASLCRDIATRLVHENHLDEALVMLEKAESYRQEFGSDRRYYKSEECLIAFRKCQIYLKQKDFARLEPLLRTVIEFCELDPSDHGSSSLPAHEYNEAVKMLGDCYAEREQFELAEQHYHKAIPPNSSERASLDVFRAYHVLLLRMNQQEKAAELLAQIERIEKQPRGWRCGQGYLTEEVNLNWEPTLSLE